MNFSFFNKKESKKQFPRLEIHITDHCNIKCTGCAHFGNIAPERFITLKEFEKDLKTINKKIDYRLLNILGGEPLLHPEIHSIFNIARKIFKNKIITMSTNGILLPTMNEIFWESVRKNNILLRISVYPINQKNIRKYLELAQKHNVKLQGLWDGRKFYLKKNPQGNSIEEEVFSTCDAKICHQVYKGNLYHCPVSAYGYIYNNYFKNNFYYKEGIDIYSNSAEKIVEYIEKPISNCKNCNINAACINWKESNLLENEWNP